MRLSEALRLSAMLGPQCFGQSAKLDLATGETSRCAMNGATLAGYRWDDFMDQPVPCPLGCHTGPYVKHVVVHLNDDHRWTREMIADWAEMIEIERQPADEPATSTNAVDPGVQSIPESLRA